MKTRLSNAAAVAVLFLIFMYSYKTSIATIYEYYGMGWRNPPEYMLISSFIMNVTLAYIASPVYRRPSQLFLVIQFLVVFLPASIVCLNVTRPEISEDRAFGMIILMYLGILFQSVFSERRSKQQSTIRRGWIIPANLIKFFLYYACLILLGTLYTLGDLFSISDLQSMYEQRELLDDKSASPILRYSISWLGFLVLPTLLIAALNLKHYHRIGLMVFCFIGYFILFGITATKTTLFAPLIIVLIYFALSRSRTSYIKKFSIGFSTLLIFPSLLNLFDYFETFSLIYLSLVNFRIFAVPQALYVQYLDFFSAHPHTFGSHVSVVSWLVSYPFNAPVYLLVGEYFYPGSNMTANAGTWAQDGIASFGLAGIIIMSAMFTAIMRILDSAAEGHDSRKVGAALSMLPLFVSNASLFTTLVSGGLAIAIVLLYVTKRSLPAQRLRPLLSWNRAAPLKSVHGEISSNSARRLDGSAPRIATPIKVSGRGRTSRI